MAAIGESAAEGATIIAHENVLNRMSAPTGKQAPTPEGAWPTDTFFIKQKNLFFNGEGIRSCISPMPTPMATAWYSSAAPTSSSPATSSLRETIRSSTCSAGRQRPRHHRRIEQIIQLSIPADKQEGGTYVIPGHGRLCDQADVVVYRDMVTIVRDRVQDMIKRGMTLAEVKAAQPTLDYDPLYGSNTAFWTTDMFVEAVYKSLAEKK